MPGGYEGRMSRREIGFREHTRPHRLPRRRLPRHKLQLPLRKTIIPQPGARSAIVRVKAAKSHQHFQIKVTMAYAPSDIPVQPSKIGAELAKGIVHPA